MLSATNTYGGGLYNLSAAAEFRWSRIQDSIARNPTFYFSNPRYFTGYAESVFPLAYFSNESTPNFAVGTSVENLNSIFLAQKYPNNFYRRQGAFDLNDIGSVIDTLRAVHPLNPGFNDGTNVNSYEVDTHFYGTQTQTICALYERFVNTTLELYPSPTGSLRDALAGNLHNLFLPLNAECTEIVPYS